MPTNADTEPWAPDPDAVPGTPPVAGSGGERGTSAFPGNADFNADTTTSHPTANTRGPNIGKSYHSNAVDLGTHSAGGRSRSHGGTADVTIALTASSNTPVHAVAVTLTATISDTHAAGPVDFFDGTTKLGTGTAASGVATYNVTAGFTQGAHVLKAVYDGITSATRTVTAS